MTKTKQVVNVTSWSTDDREFVQLNGRVQIGRRNQYNRHAWKQYGRISAYSIARLKRAAATRIEAGQWGERIVWGNQWIAGENYLPLPEKKRVKMSGVMDPHRTRLMALKATATRKRKPTQGGAA